MSTCYDFQSKSCYQPDDARFKTMTEALSYFKKMLRQCCSIQPELVAIAQPELPAPRYRASVCSYLYDFFCTGKFPSCDTIDYSDYLGKRRGFPAKMREEDAEEASGYERVLGFEELYCYRGVTSYDRSLGFIFAASKRGFHLELLTTTSNLKTICYFYRREGLAAFGFEPMEGERPSFDARIFRSEGELPTKLTGSFYSAMLLSILLSQRDKCQIELTEKQQRALRDDSTDLCLLWKLNSEIYKKMNDGLVLPSNFNLSERTIERYIESLKRFGYTIEEIEKEYYIPPFINIRDADMIISSIEGSELDVTRKRELISKFGFDSGYHRYANDIDEEAANPLPPYDNWEKGDYSLIILNMLRLCDRPLPMTSGKKESLQGLIEQHYGIKIGRVAISDNLKAMIAMGLPVKQEGDLFVFDSKNSLRKADIDLIKECIRCGALPDTASRLISKIDERLPIGKY